MKKEDLKIKNIKKVEIDFNAYLSGRDQMVFDESVMGKELWNSFLDDLLNTIKISEWNKAYRNSEILDGFGWEVKITGKDNGVITFYGVNDYPNNWEAFEDLIKLIKEKIEHEKENL